jgi:flavin-dependent dehydrogenase
MQQTDILIAGGGLAGLTCAIHLAMEGLSVVLIEKEIYPHHKVCGEYISNEVLPYLKSIDADPESLSPVHIDELLFTTATGKHLSTSLPLGGFGLSRFCFDEFLYTRALLKGCEIITDQVIEIKGQVGSFEIFTHSGKSFAAKVVLGAFGKRSTLDVKLQRPFIQKKSPWLAVKAHYKGQHNDHVVGLHTFEGGYCGVSKVENDVINICYLVQYQSFKKYKNIEEHREQVLYRNPALKNIFEQATCLFDKPLTISQVSFEHKAAVEDHILMVGDTAGLIHPLCGNGMAMAIHSAKIASELVIQYFNEEIDGQTLEQLYSKEWNNMFRKRLRAGRYIAALLQKEKLSSLLTGAMALFPGLLPLLIKKTHGKPIKIANDARKHAV